MSMVSCPNCGHPNVETAKFCAKCGNKLTPVETMVMGSLDASAPLSSDPSTPPASAKEQAAYSPPPFAPPPAASSYSPPPSAPAYAPPPPAQPIGGPGYAGGPIAATGPGAAAGHRYVAMRTIAGLCNILAWISLVLGFLGGLVSGYVFGSNLLGSGIFGVIGGLIGGAIAGALGWIYWRLLGEGIWLALDIESNTRRSAVALEEQRRS